MSEKILNCPFCGETPVFPDSIDVIGTCYDCGCENCGIATISLQIIDCFNYPRDHVHESWDDVKMQYAPCYIDIARNEAINLLNSRK